MTFSAELRCYIGSHTLAPWPTVLAGVLPSWLMALGPDVVAHCARPLAPWCMAPSLAHAKGPLPAAPTAVGHVVMSLSRGPRRQMYVFAKFVANHIFLQNRDKINIKNSILGMGIFVALFFWESIFVARCGRGGANKVSTAHQKVQPSLGPKHASSFLQSRRRIWPYSVDLTAPVISTPPGGW
jgi:hypothetical protein